VSTKAVYGKVYEEIGTYDLSVTSLQFEDDTFATIETGWNLPSVTTNWLRPNKWQPAADIRMDILGTEGRLWMGGVPTNLIGLVEDGLRFPELMNWPDVNGRTVGALKTELEHFIDCILYDRMPLITEDQVLTSLKILLAAEQSIKEKKEIKISSIL
jgi:UDP-N-acetylglucosamine 3-dehydrogenase